MSGPFRSEQRVADVLGGKIKVANAAWWGFDEIDATAALQGAINSGATTVIVPYVGKKWIVKPITLVSNQEIVFAPGVVVSAKKGEFKGDHDSLFRAAQKENITLRGYGARWQMRKEDYRDPNHYIRAEWRMGFMCLSSKNINVLGITIADTGGDGIYLGSSAAEFIGKPAYNRDIVIKDCVFDNNYRQGISVIGAKNLLIENCLFKNTSGTAPGDGIDFEPNSDDNKLTNCIVRNCIFENNEGCGIEICVTHLTENTEAISVKIEDCHVRSSKRAGLTIGTVRKTGVKGLIELKNCTFENIDDVGYAMWDTPASSIHIRFVNCSWRNVTLSKTPLDLHAPLSDIATPGHKPDSVGYTEFVNCRLYGRKDKPFLLPVELEKSSGIHLINDK
jgi:hypothetical protein